jgi:hypothetical protein
MQSTGVKQQRLWYSTQLETSWRALEKLRSIITIDFKEDPPQDSDTPEYTMGDSVEDSATSTRGVEITRSANADISDSSRNGEDNAKGTGDGEVVVGGKYKCCELGCEH